MKIHLRADRYTPVHTYFSLFVNGAKTGSLVMRNAEACWFHHVLWKGLESLRLPAEGNRTFRFNASGEFPEVESRLIEEEAKREESSGWDGPMSNVHCGPKRNPFYTHDDGGIELRRREKP